MVRTDLFEEFIHCDEPVVVLESNSVYINGIEVKFGECILDDIKNVQFKIDRIIELIFRPETVIVFVPKGCDVNTAYPTKYRIWIKVIFDGEMFYKSTEVEVIAHYDKEEYKIVFNSKFPMPEELEDALTNCVERGIFVSKG